MSKLETLIIEWFSLEEKLPTEGKDIFLKLDNKDLIHGRYLLTEKDRRKHYMLLEAGNSYIEVYLENIVCWAYYVYPEGL